VFANFLNKISPDKLRATPEPIVVLPSKIKPFHGE